MITVMVTCSIYLCRVNFDNQNLSHLYSWLTFHACVSRKKYIIFIACYRFQQSSEAASWRGDGRPPVVVRHHDGACGLGAALRGDGTFRVSQRAAAGSQGAITTVAVVLQAEVPRVEKHAVFVDALRAVCVLPRVPAEGRG